MTMNYKTYVVKLLTRSCCSRQREKCWFITNNPLYLFCVGVPMAEQDFHGALHILNMWCSLLTIFPGKLPVHSQW